MMKKFFKAVKELRIIYKQSKDPEVIAKYNEYGIDVNWIGEPYYSFSVPEEFFESSQTLNSYVYKKIEDTYHVFEKVGSDQYLYNVTYVDYKNKICLIHLIVNKKPIKWGIIQILFYIATLTGLYFGFRKYF